MLDLSLLAIGSAVVLLGRRVDPAGVAVPTALLTYVVILFAVSGSPLQGGIGGTYARHGRWRRWRARTAGPSAT